MDADGSAADVSPEFARVFPQLVEWDQQTLDDHWRLVGDLVANHGDGVLEAAVIWSASVSRAAQGVGLDLLGVLGVDDEEARNALLGAAEELVGSPAEEVRWSVAVALGRNSTDGRTTRYLLQLAADEDEDVRF